LAAIARQSGCERPVNQDEKVTGSCAETGLRSRGDRSIDVAKTHVQPHLVVGDVEAGQALIPSCVMENQMLEPTAPDRQTLSSSPEKRAPGVS
jgi:hypothetical protein